MKLECPRCHTRIEKPLSGDPVCPTCGFGGASDGPGAGPLSGGSTPAASTSGAGAATSVPGIGAPAGPGPTSGPATGAASGGYFAPPTSGGWNAAAGPAQPPSQGLSITALVLGILGCCVPYLGLLLAAAAIVVGSIALSKHKKEPQRYGGRGMALTGLILGIIGVVIGLILLIFLFALPGVLWEAAGCAEDPSQDICKELRDPDAQTAASGWPTVAMAGVLAVPLRCARR